MTLKECKVLIESIAEQQPNINTIIKSGDIYELNTKPDVRYCAFCCTQQPHTESGGFRNYNFYLFVVDNLLHSNVNKIAVQSNAIEVLSNIINTLKNNDELEIENTITYTTFTQRFASECAGAYCYVSISVPLNNCFTDYGEN